MPPSCLPLDVANSSDASKNKRKIHACGHWQLIHRHTAQNNSSMCANHLPKQAAVVALLFRQLREASRAHHVAIRPDKAPPSGCFTVLVLELQL